MSPRDRLYQLAWPAFKQLAISALGRLEAAKLMRECADWLETEHRTAEARDKASNVVSLAEARG